MPELTKNQTQLRELWLKQSLETWGDEDELIEKLRTEDGLTNKQIEEFIELIEKEYQTGIYLYPPPLITQENAHLHMVEPDDSWMYA